MCVREIRETRGWKMTTQQTGQHRVVRSSALPATPDDGASNGPRSRITRLELSSQMPLAHIIQAYRHLLMDTMFSIHAHLWSGSHIFNTNLVLSQPTLVVLLVVVHCHNRCLRTYLILACHMSFRFILNYTAHSPITPLRGYITSVQMFHLCSFPANGYLRSTLPHQ